MNTQMEQSSSTSLPAAPSSSTLSHASSTKTRRERALDGIRTFLESKSCYDILPESFRASAPVTRASDAGLNANQSPLAPLARVHTGLIVFDNKLSITRSLQALVTNGEAPSAILLAQFAWRSAQRGATTWDVNTTYALPKSWLGVLGGDGGSPTWDDLSWAMASRGARMSTTVDM